jgi:hypothetical protein
MNKGLARLQLDARIGRKMKENAKNFGKSWHQFGTKVRAEVSIAVRPPKASNG